MTRISLALCAAGLLAGCAQGGYQAANQEPRYYRPLPPPYQVPFTPMQIQPQQQPQPRNCTTRWVGGTAYTSCY